MRQVRQVLATLLIMVSIHVLAQSSADPEAHGAPDPPAVPAPSISPPHSTSSAYTFPEGRQQFRNYLYYTFGPPALISTAIGAGLDQSKPAPPEWDSGAEGYGERYGWRFGMNMVTQTTQYSLGALTHEDVAYHRCDCSGLFPRGAHAVVSTLTAKTRGGRTVFSVPALVSPYAGSFTAVNAWYPSRYEPSDAVRIANISFAFKVVGNLIGEFIAPRR